MTPRALFGTTGLTGTDWVIVVASSVVWLEELRELVFRRITRDRPAVAKAGQNG